LLDRARTGSPGTLANIHARPEFVLNEMLVEATGSVATTFERGAIRTGPSRSTSPTAQPAVYVLSFRAPIQVSRLVTAVKQLPISDLSGVYPNGIVGDGDNIFAQHTADGWVIAFVHGEGDCPAGCMMRTRPAYWSVTTTPCGSFPRIVRSRDPRPTVQYCDP
jgi:hypothetical protein